MSRAAQLTAGVWVTRSLDPRDFTLLAVIFAIQGFVLQISALNLTSELVRAPSIEKEDLCVAWSYEFVRNLVLWSVLVAFAPMLAASMKHPELIWGIRLSACGLLIGSLRNPRLVELRREGRFGRLGWIESAPLLVYALCSIIFVHFRPDYYSLIYAGLASSFVGVFISYHRLPWRPSLNFDFQRLRPMLAFGLVLLLGSGAFAMREHGIVFIVSASESSGDLGYINRGIAFSMALALQATGVFWKVAYPHFARVHLQGGDVPHDAIVINRWLLIPGIPLALFAGFYSNPIIDFTLGAKWQPVAPLWTWLVLAGAIFLTNAPLEAALQAMRREKIQLLISAISTALYLVIAGLLLPKYGIVAVGMGACASTVFSFIFLQCVIRKFKTCKSVTNTTPH